MKLLTSSSPLQEISGKVKPNTIQLYKENQADRTTRMLLAVLLLFLITEVPKVIIGIGGIGAILAWRSWRTVTRTSICNKGAKTWKPTPSSLMTQTVISIAVKMFSI
ncbi:hypothetical protein NQ317_013595 [Molorchus minor]|uniref:Uncharacterized protein n=1 Tax=Molorchus minor TaxID=1323400 RepID=A0ABQ9J850_9CUCU|nr:hypothetical protein NQ317_013595 [Molorchus minor]